MDNQVLLNILYDYYGELLTDKQRKYFKDYYFDNLTLKEISDKLFYYEDKLKLYQKSLALKKIIINLDDDLKNKILELI